MIDWLKFSGGVCGTLF